LRNREADIRLAHDQIVDLEDVLALDRDDVAAHLSHVRQCLLQPADVLLDAVGRPHRPLEGHIVVDQGANGGEVFLRHRGEVSIDDLAGIVRCHARVLPRSFHDRGQYFRYAFYFYSCTSTFVLLSLVRRVGGEGASVLCAPPLDDPSATV